MSKPGDLRGSAIQRIFIEACSLHDTDRACEGPRHVTHGDANPALPDIQSSYPTHSV